MDNQYGYADCFGKLLDHSENQSIVIRLPLTERAKSLTLGEQRLSNALDTALAGTGGNRLKLADKIRTVLASRVPRASEHMLC